MLGNTYCGCFKNSYLCRQCRTCISSAENLISRNPELTETAKGLFKNNIHNVVVAEHIQVENGVLSRVDYVFCKCGTLLGKKIVDSAEEHIPAQYGSIVFHLRLNSLLLSNWTETIRYADTNELVARKQ